MNNLLKKILGNALRFVPGAHPASWWRPALIAFFALAWLVTQVILPLSGAAAIALDPWFYKAWLALAGVYGLLRTGEKARGTSPEGEALKEDVRRLESKLNALLTDKAKRKIKESAESLPGGVPDVEIPSAPELLPDPDGEGMKMAPLGPAMIKTESEPSTSED